MILDTIRRLRHGPLAAFSPAWLFLGRHYRRWARLIPGLRVSQKIGRYGPFKLLPEFTFSNLEGWGSGHNKGFAACVEACRGKSCVLDVGAHVGFVALPIASVLLDNGRLYAFEPAEANVRVLRRHLALNGFNSVKVVPALVGETECEAVPFYESVGPHGQNSIVLKGENTLMSEAGGYASVMRPQVSLDGFCQRAGLAPEVIKIDVEGAEVGVLRGARNILAQHRPILILSVHPREIVLAGESLDRLRAVVAEAGYEICDINENPVENLALDEYIVVPRERFRNVSS